MRHEDDEDTSAKSTVKTSQHIPCSICFKITFNLPGYEERQVTCKFGPNFIEEFLDDLDRIYERVETDLTMNKPMEDIDNTTKQQLICSAQAWLSAWLGRRRREMNGKSLHFYSCILVLINS